MRNLTIKRNKTFVACAATMKVYIEDPDSTELTINGVTCRKLGTLKNGEEKTFPISEQALKVFVIADKLSRNHCSEVMQLPAGTENISLSGKNHFNPTGGNPFYFDGVTDRVTLDNRKHTKKSGTIIMVAALIVGLLLGIVINALEPTAPKTFTTAGMEITLTDDFRESKLEGFTMCYGSKDMAVYTIKEVFSLVEGFGDYTVEEYCQQLLQANELDGKVQIQNHDGLLFFECSAPGDKGTEYHMSFFFKASDAFWSIQFAVLEEDAAQLRDTILDYAKSVTFTK